MPCIDFATDAIDVDAISPKPPSLVCALAVRGTAVGRAKQ
jgi:hypothetical protein